MKSKRYLKQLYVTSLHECQIRLELKLKKIIYIYVGQLIALHVNMPDSQTSLQAPGTLGGVKGIGEETKQSNKHGI